MTLLLIGRMSPLPIQLCDNGHNHSNLCAVFKYIWSNVFLQATAGPSLGGWPHPQHRVSPMNFDPVIEDLRVDSSGDDYNLGLHGCLWRFTVTPVNFSMSSTTAAAAAAAAASETATVAQ